MKILTCNSNRPLADAISAYLRTPLTNASVRRFSDMEVFVEIHENVRGEDVFVIQSTSYPANDNLMELLVTLDALRRASARRITAVIPYYGYARQDRKSGGRTPISAKLVANMITAAGADRVLTLDLHAGQIQGFFDIPTDNLYAAPVFIKDIKERYNGEDLVVVSPDVGGVVRARAVARRLDADLAIIDKRRERAGVSRPMSRMACCRAARWRGSAPRRWNCSSPPTASSPPRRCASPRTSASSPSRRSWPRRSGASATSARCRACSIRVQRFPSGRLSSAGRRGARHPWRPALASGEARAKGAGPHGS